MKRKFLPNVPCLQIPCGLFFQLVKPAFAEVYQACVLRIGVVPENKVLVLNENRQQLSAMLNPSQKTFACARAATYE